MSVFGAYSLYYNLLYADKDYAAESAFVLGLLQKYGKKPATVLDLGCGTGRHDLELARKGIHVTGLDLSESMLEMGKLQIAEAETGQGSVELLRGNACSARLGRTFDAVISLFHVLSYQTESRQALEMLRTAAAHLEPGGLFLADFWFGPAVLRIWPEERAKIMENDLARVSRHAMPQIDVCKDVVNVHYDIEIEDRATGEKSELAEDHPMRYWFLPELAYLARKAGFEVAAYGAWEKESAPGVDDWAAWILCRKFHID